MAELNEHYYLVKTYFEMGSATHYKALMRKNWILWKRSLCVSIIELMCPVVLFGLILLLRGVVVQETEEATNFLYEGATMYYPNKEYAFFDKKEREEHSYVDFVRQLDEDELEDLREDSDDPDNVKTKEEGFVFQAGLFDPAAAMFLANSCIKTDFTNVNRTEIAVTASGPNGKAVLEKVMKPLKNYLRFLNAVAWSEETYEKFEADPRSQDPEVKYGRKVFKESGLNDFQFLPYLGISVAFSEFLLREHFYIQVYDSFEDMVAYSKDKKYMLNSQYPGICFGFSIDHLDPGYDVKMFYSDTVFIEEQQNMPYQIDLAADPFISAPDKKKYNLYINQGFSYVQNWIANAILKVETKKDDAYIDMGLALYPTPKYTADDFALIISSLLPFFLLLVYILPVGKLVERMVSEKESRARESMKIMGMSDVAYYLSWWTYFSIQVTIITIIGMVMMKPAVFPNSDGLMIFLFLWIYGMSLFGFCLLVTPFFSKARSASIFSAMLYFGSNFLTSVVQDQSVDLSAKKIASILPTIGLELAALNLGVFENSKLGANFENYAIVYKNYSIKTFLDMAICSFFVFGIIGLYLDKVLPSQYGVRQPPYFFLLPSFWLSTKKRDTVKCPEFTEDELMKKENYEDVSDEIKKLEKENKLLKIYGLERHFGDFKAVNGVNLKMYEGQIFALLGHNGAGKTTTISMLTGLIESTKGQAEVYGIDMFNEMDKARNIIGVCPQHDVLFDNLTPEEHLSVFCDFKGFNGNKSEEIDKILKDVDLLHLRSTVAKNLSGGSKRKLSLGIALCGGSKVVLLDEPTSGMDLTARRQMWEMLKSYKNDRIIILTTHYMDEADILGDRIGIMVAGKIFCLGPQLFLKHRFGVGYKLTLVKSEEIPNTLAEPFLTQHLGIVTVEDESKGEITFKIPENYASKFQNFFAILDMSLEQIRVTSYGISVTTLEEVFLKVGHGEEDDHVKKAKKDILSQNSDSGDEKQKLSEGPISGRQSNRVGDIEANQNYSIAKQHIKSSTLMYFKQVKAVLQKRINIYKRNLRGLILEVFVPVLIVLIGLGLTRLEFFKSAPSRPHSVDLFPAFQNVLTNKDLMVLTSKNQDPSTDILFSKLSIMDKINLKPVKIDGKDDYEKLVDFNQRILFNSFDDVKHYDYFSYIAYSIDQSAHKYKLASFVNGTSQDIVAIAPTFLYEATLRLATGNEQFRFTMTNEPMPIPQVVLNREGASDGIFLSFMIAIGFSLIPASIISHAIQERNSGVKHQQLISGMGLFAYWTANYIFEMIKTEIPVVLSLGLIYAFDQQLPLVWIVFLVLPIGLVPFTIGLSYIFNQESSAMSSVMFVNFTIGGLGGIAVFILTIIESTYEWGNYLTWGFRAIPIFSVTHTINFQASKDSYEFLRPDWDVSNWRWIHSGGDIYCLLIHFVFWSFFVIINEMSFIRNFDYQPRANNIQRKTPEELMLDQDVIDEETRVRSSEDLNIKIDNFRKIYGGFTTKPTLAVEGVSVGVNQGECFCLLGVNGAGKSTTFKALTGEYHPTEGNVEINGLSVKDNFAKVCKMIGYCPQYDAIFYQMTVIEHLQFYALVKGIIPSQVDIQINKCIKELDLEFYRDKQAGSLSGGNKRKLSVAMALLGNPPIILLDEPSAGMDPIARQFMWRVVSNQRKNQSAVVLTTHSMEEALFLSTKLGIMVRGGIFRCFGTAMHIQNKFGDGYEVEAKIRKLSDKEIEDKAATQQDFKPSDRIVFAQAQTLLKAYGCQKDLVDEVSQEGLGHELWKQAEDNKGVITIKSIVQWNHVHTFGRVLIEKLVEDFKEVEIVEQYSDYFKLKVPRVKGKTIGYLFGLIEAAKEDCNISEYSVQQTTLEQIFQRFANLELNRASTVKFTKDANGKVTSVKQTLKREEMEAKE